MWGVIQRFLVRKWKNETVQEQPAAVFFRELHDRNSKTDSQPFLTFNYLDKKRDKTPKTSNVFPARQ